MTVLDASQQLADVMSGRVLLPGEDWYDDARVSFNGMLDRRPALIARCETAEDVRHAVRCAGALDLPISIRGGGHSVAGHGMGDGALMIDLSQLRGVSVDAERRLARVQGGCIWSDVDTATQAVGLAVPGGTYADTGVAGLTLGGGIGWLLGTAGLTCDNLIGAELVSGTGESVVAGERGDPELLWALRGGGGNFGVVTTFEFTLHPRGPLVGGFLWFARENIASVLEAAQAVADTAPDELVLMPETGGTAGLCRVGVAFSGGVVDAERSLAPLRACARVVADNVGPKTYLELQAMNELLPFGLRHYWKGHFLDRLDAAAIAVIADGTAACPHGESGVLIEALTGAARRVPDSSSAFGQRGASWNVSAIAIWEDAADDDTMIAWARRLAGGLEPFSASGGGYVNYAPPDETPERVLAAYGPERFARLAAVKRRYDPENRLRFNLNIPPA